MTGRIAVADPRADIQDARAELVAAFEQVLDSGRYVLAEQLATFEREWARYCGVDHAVGTSSGTDALALALRAVGVGPGDEVVVPAMTALATWMAVAQVGAIPVGADILPGGAIDPASVRAAVGARTRAVVAVHLFGQPVDAAALRSITSAAGIALVEDAAQAHGATDGGTRVGGLGTIAAFSFYPTKNLGTLGDAGAVVTTDPELADRVRLLRQYGWRTRADAEVKGVNARMDELHAALLSVLLRGLDERTRRRRAIAQRYLEGLEGLQGLDLPHPRPGTEPVWHLFVVLHENRDALAAELSARGIETGVHYAPPPHLMTAFRADGWRSGDFPVAERHAATALSLPMHSALSNDRVDRVIAALGAACAISAGAS